ASSDIRKPRMVAEGLARVDVGQERLDKGNACCQQRIAQGDAGVRKGSRIENDEVDAFGACRVDALDQFGFGIALQAQQVVSRSFRLFAQSCVNVGQGLLAVDIRFAGAQQVEV